MGALKIAQQDGDRKEISAESVGCNQFCYPICAEVISVAKGA
jgi:hypothetical protein